MTGVRSAVVLGAGIAGLTTAVRLLEAGWAVEVVSGRPLEASTSYLAAAVWFPTHVGPPDRVQDWGARTYDVLRSQAEEQVPGVVMRETLVLSRVPMGRPDWVEAVGTVRPARDAELPPGYPFGLRFVVPLVEMPVYLPWLWHQVASRGGRFRTQRVTALAARWPVPGTPWSTAPDWRPGRSSATPASIPSAARSCASPTPV